MARRQGTTVDSIIAIALSSQVSAWQVRDTFEQRAARGKSEELAEILASAPDAPPSPGDEYRDLVEMLRCGNRPQRLYTKVA